LRKQEEIKKIPKKDLGKARSKHWLAYFYRLKNTTARRNNKWFFELFWCQKLWIPERIFSRIDSKENKSGRWERCSKNIKGIVISVEEKRMHNRKNTRAKQMMDGKVLVVLKTLEEPHIL